MTLIASFDVFDTAITRIIGGPRQVFVETGRRLRRAGLISIDAGAYATSREEAGWSLTSDLAQHPSLSRIADEVASRLGLPASAGETLMSMELEVELDACRAVPGFARRADQQRRNTGRGVVYISDTPLPTEFLRDLLRREGLFVPADHLYTSAESQASKQDGGLFDLVSGDLGVAPTEMVHVGDDTWADLAHGRLHGWKASLDSRAGFTAREGALDRQDVATDGIGPRLAGAARMGRLAAVEDGVEPAIAGIAGAVALPLLAGFGLWVLQQAQSLQLDRLYFVARDGEVLRSVAHRLAQQASLQIECRYLYGSRRSWQLAHAGTSAYDLDAQEWWQVDSTAESLSARSILDRVGISAQDALALTGHRIFAPDDVDQPLSGHRWEDLHDVVVADPLAGEIRRRTRAQRDLLIRYLNQEQVTAPGRVGIVDVGWTGRAARALEDVLIDADRSVPTAHLFVGLLSTSAQVMGADLRARSQGWLVDEAVGRGWPTNGADPVMVVESFCMASHGHTLGYDLADDRVEPVLAAEKNPAADVWCLAGFRTALDRALDTLVELPPLNDTVDLRPLVGSQLMNFWHRPSRAEALAWGSQPYGEDVANTAAHPLATRVTTRRILTRLGVGRAAWREPTYWMAGTIAVSNEPWRDLLAAAERSQRMLRRASRIPKRLRAEWVIRWQVGS